MEKSYTIVYVEYVGFGRGKPITKYRHCITDNLKQEIKNMEAWACDVQFVFDGICKEVE